MKILVQSKRPRLAIKTKLGENCASHKDPKDHKGYKDPEGHVGDEGSKNCINYENSVSQENHELKFGIIGKKPALE